MRRVITMLVIFGLGFYFSYFYPEDLAYDFQIGDLRGIYAVIMPELQQSLEEK